MACCVYPLGHVMYIDCGVCLPLGSRAFDLTPILSAAGSGISKPGPDPAGHPATLDDHYESACGGYCAGWCHVT